MRALPAVLFCSWLCVAAATAHANPNELFLGSNTRALRSTSADALTGDSLGGGQLGYARLLPLAPLPRVTLWAEGSFVTGFASGRMFDQLDTEVSSLGFALGVRAQYEIARHVSLGARVALGGAHQSLTLTQTEGGMQLSDARWGATATVGALAEVHALETRRVSVGFRLEVAYTAAQAVALQAHADTSGGDTIMLPRSSAELGHLDLGGPSVAASIVTRF